MADSGLAVAATSDVASKPLRSPDGDSGPDCSRHSAYVYLALFAPAIAVVVFSNWKWNALVNDTLLLTSSFETIERFSSLFSNANANPLQGLFDILPSGLRADTIPNLIGHALIGPGMHVNFFYSCCAVLLAYAVAAMARTVGLRWCVAVLGGILVPLLLLPTFGMFPLDEHFYILWPITYYSTAGTVLVTAAFWRIDGRSRTQFVLLTSVIAVVLAHLSVIDVLFMTILAPAMLAMGVGALSASSSRREFFAKIVSAAVVAAALACAGIFHYLYAIGIDTAPHVFYQELMDFMNFAAPSWSVIRDDIGMVIINPFTHAFKGGANIDGVLVPLSQLGALHLAIFGRTRNARIFGRTVLGWVVATAFVIAILHNFYFYTGIMYQGPDPRHFIPILWPYYAICVASLAFACADRGAALASRAWPATRNVASAVPHALVLCVLAGPVIVVSVNRFAGLIAPNVTLGSQIFQTYLPSFHYYQRTPVLDYLEPRVAAAIDREFRGSVVSMPTVFDKDTKPYAAWRRETTFAYARAYLANDLGAFGLRYYNVPTLDEETHTVSPQLYLLVRELLSRPDIDAYDKHFALVTRLNEPIMTLLGLRYVIADYEIPFGAERLAMPIPDEARKVLEGQHLYKSPVRIFELPEPNLGNYSPTHMVVAKTAAQAIVAMSAETFDGRETFLADDAALGDRLVPATRSVLTVRMGGVALRASSTGQSVLILPVQYSHCWQVTQGGGATLFRANLMQLGVRFSGDLRVELRQMFGPFWQSSCRVADAADVDRLDMVGAVGSGAESYKVPGDGINLIPSPEALDTAVGSSAIASVTPVSAADEAVHQYAITAQGTLSEHYAVLGTLTNLTPGPYTLSLQVRADSAPVMALQIKDGVNGAVADYLIPARNVFVSRLGQGDKLNATMRKVDRDWIQLTLTSTLVTGKGFVFLHLKDKGSRGTFASNAETVTIRALKLERGQTATPYPGRAPEPAAKAVEEPKVTGDGINLVAAPEALETAIASTPIATIAAGPATSGPREYTITGRGKYGEHYSVFSVPKLPPGPYTLSLHVRAGVAAHVYLQILDGANGAMADYFLPARTASVTSLGRGTKLNATVRRVDDEWLVLTLTSTLEAEPGYVIIELADKGGRRNFLPTGETVTIRSVKLERGEIATPYARLGQQ